MERETELSYEEKLERLKFYRSEIALEWNLLSNRLNSFITSQSFLVTAYAISLGNSSPVLSVYYFTLVFPIIVCIVGGFTSLLAYPGIDGAIKVIKVWRAKQNNLFFINPSAQSGDVEYHLPDEKMVDFQDRAEMGKVAKRPTLSEAVALFFTRRPKAEELKLHQDLGGVDTIDDVHARSLYFTRYSPRVFFCAWVCLTILAVVLHMFAHTPPIAHGLRIYPPSYHGPG